MCDPVTLSVAAMVAGGASAYQASEARKAGAEYDSAVARNNAQVSKWKASDAEDRATTNAMNIGRQVNDVRGKQSAALAANGLDLGFGSAAGSLAKTDYFGLVDQKTAIENGNNEAWGFRQQASQYETQAKWASRLPDVGPGSREPLAVCWHVNARQCGQRGRQVGQDNPNR